jgi:hypothetical protein
MFMQLAKLMHEERGKEQYGKPGAHSIPTRSLA